MITIYIDPIEYESCDACDSGKRMEREPRTKRNITRYIVVIVLLICLIIISLITACSTAPAPCSYIPSAYGSPAGFLAFGQPYNMNVSHKYEELI